MQDIEVIARAVIMRGDKILLAHAKGSPNTFLPGGHIEKGEFTRDALKRELIEELGVEASIGEYIGTLEYIYKKIDGEKVQEINIIFNADIGCEEVSSRERSLDFIWTETEDLEKAALLPEPLPILLRAWMENPKPVYECMIESSYINDKLKSKSN